MNFWDNLLGRFQPLVTCSDCGVQLEIGYAHQVKTVTGITYYCQQHKTKYTQRLGTRYFDEFEVDPANGNPVGYLPKDYRTVKAWLATQMDPDAQAVTTSSVQSILPWNYGDSWEPPTTSTKETKRKKRKR